jgi:hypothetical protein
MSGNQDTTVDSSTNDETSPLVTDTPAVVPAVETPTAQKADTKKHESVGMFSRLENWVVRYRKYLIAALLVLIVLLILAHHASTAVSGSGPAPSSTGEGWYQNLITGYVK